MKITKITPQPTVEQSVSGLYYICIKRVISRTPEYLYTWKASLPIKSDVPTEKDWERWVEQYIAEANWPYRNNPKGIKVLKFADGIWRRIEDK